MSEMPKNSSRQATSDLHSGASASGDPSKRQRVTEELYLTTHSLYGFLNDSELEIDDEVVDILIERRFRSIRKKEDSAVPLEADNWGIDSSSTLFAIPFPKKKVFVERASVSEVNGGWRRPSLILRRQEGSEGFLLGKASDQTPDYETRHPRIRSIILDLELKTYYLTDQLERKTSTASDSKVEPPTATDAQIQEIKRVRLWEYRYGGFKTRTEGTIMTDAEVDAAIDNPEYAERIVNMTEAEVDVYLDEVMSVEAGEQLPDESAGI